MTAAAWSIDDEHRKFALIEALTLIEQAVESFEEHAATSDDDLYLLDKLGNTEAAFLGVLNPLNARHHQAHPQHDHDGFTGRCRLVDPTAI